jgi:uncharacterized protein (TIGR02246 family)
VTEKKSPTTGVPSAGKSLNVAVEQFLKNWQAETGERPPSDDAIRLALRALTEPSLEADTQTALQAVSLERQSNAEILVCDICGHQNRAGNQFCGMCGLPLPESLQSLAAPRAYGAPEREPRETGTQSSRPGGGPHGQHFYHHHFHHHYFGAMGEQGAGASFTPRSAGPEATRDPSKVRATGANAPMSRVEAAVRKLMQDWALACNTRHLEDLVGIYASDAMLLRPNHPAFRGTQAIREHFVSILDAGFCDAELEPLRVEAFGDVAYEAGRYKALVPVAVSKRREERGKYLTLLIREPNGEWKILSDCWSSDLGLGASAEAEQRAVAPVPPPKAGFPRKS